MKTKTLLTIAAFSLVVLALVGVSYTQIANAQTVPPTVNPDNHAPQCISCNTGPNAPPCWSNSARLGTCGECCTNGMHNQPGPCWK